MNKKPLIILLAAALLASCTKPNTVEIDVTVTGLPEGVFIIKDAGDHTILGDNIKNGKCIAKGVIDAAGFFTLDITKPKDKPHMPFEVYIEPGKYTVTADAKNLNRYPKIVSESKTQQGLSAFYEIEDQMGKSVRQQAFQLDQELVQGRNTLSQDEYRDISAKLANAQDKERSIQFNALAAFAKKYPESDLTAHLMARQDYKDFPEKYRSLLNTFTDAAKNSDEGKQIAKDLGTAMQLQPGQSAPAIAGDVFDGRTFKDVTKGKKIFLIDFWRSANQFSRMNHDTITAIFRDFKNRGLQVISVSLDKKKLWWATAVKDDKLPWPQMSDLKGNDSPNAALWGITTIPTYYLVTGDWKIYKKDISLGQIRLETRQYLDKHQ